MKDLLLYIARSLVEHPDDVTVTEKQGADELTLELRVAPDDMGKVIGRQGRIAKEIRTVVRKGVCRHRRLNCKNVPEKLSGTFFILAIPRRFRYTGWIEQNKGA